MEQTQKNWVGKIRTLPRKVLTGVIALVKKGYRQLKSRYGPRYTKAMAGAAFVALFSPIPGSVLVAVALIVVIAEVHRAVSEKGGFTALVTFLGRTNTRLGFAFGISRAKQRPLKK